MKNKKAILILVLALLFSCPSLQISADLRTPFSAFPQEQRSAEQRTSNESDQILKGEEGGETLPSTEVLVEEFAKLLGAAGLGLGIIFALKNKK